MVVNTFKLEAHNGAAAHRRSVSGDRVPPRVRHIFNSMQQQENVFTGIRCRKMKKLIYNYEQDHWREKGIPEHFGVVVVIL